MPYHAHKKDVTNGEGRSEPWCNVEKVLGVVVAQHHFELTLQRPGEGCIPPHVRPEQDVPGVCTDEYLCERVSIHPFICLSVCFFVRPSFRTPPFLYGFQI